MHGRNPLGDGFACGLLSKATPGVFGGSCHCPSPVRTLSVHSLTHFPSAHSHTLPQCTLSQCTLSHSSPVHTLTAIPQCALSQCTLSQSSPVRTLTLFLSLHTSVSEKLVARPWTAGPPVCFSRLSSAPFPPHFLIPQASWLTL